MLFRLSLLGSVALAASACASNPVAPERAPILYRTITPGSMAAQTADTPTVFAKPKAPLVAAAIPPPRVVDMGRSTTPAIQEAKALAPEAGLRPGGSLRQPKDKPDARAIEVLAGDTLYDISRRYSVNMRAFIETNQLAPPYALEHGSVIHLPPPNVHAVGRGETLYSVSRRYNVDTRSLALLNGLARPWTVWPGDELLLPPLARDQGRKTTAAQVRAGSPPSRASGKASAPAAAANAAIVLTPPNPAATQTLRPAMAENPKGRAEFIWPVTGPVLKGFGAGVDGQRNDGVNIEAPRGTPVKAAASGEVVYAGDELVGFGNLVLIRHAGGWVSAYAHSDSLLVKEGDQVLQGQAIASAGATGNAASPQVHFELRKGKEPVDPAEYMPALQS